MKLEHCHPHHHISHHHIHPITHTHTPHSSDNIQSSSILGGTEEDNIDLCTLKLIKSSSSSSTTASKHSSLSSSSSPSSPSKQSWILRIYILNCEYRTIRIDQNTTVESVCKVLGIKMKFMNPQSAHLYFGLFLSQDFGTNFFQRLHMKDSFLKQYKRHTMGKNPKHVMVVFKIHLFMDQEIMMSTDPVIRSFLYFQAVHDLLTGYYPCSVEQAVWIGALNCQYRFGDYEENVNRAGYYSAHCGLKDILPFWLVDRREGETPSQQQIRLEKLEWAIMEAHRKMISLTSTNARDQVMENCKHFSFYGNVFFLVGIEHMTKKMLNLSPGRQTLIIGISIVGLKLFEKSNKSCIRRFLFRNLSTWGFTQSGDFFVDATFRKGGGSAREGKDETPKRLVFKTDKGKMIADLLNEYAKAIMKSGRYTHVSHHAASTSSEGVVGGDDDDDEVHDDDDDNDDKKDNEHDGNEHKEQVHHAGLVNILKAQGLIRGWILRRQVHQNAAALLIQSAWRGHKARMAIDFLIAHMTNLLLSEGVDVMQAVKDVQKKKKEVREDMV